MLGLSCWTEKGDSYWSVQRFFYTAIPWAQVFWVFFQAHLLDRQDTLSWLLASSSRYFGIFDVNFVRSRLCLLTGPTLNDAFIDNKLFIGGLYKIEIVFG